MNRDELTVSFYRGATGTNLGSRSNIQLRLVDLATSEMRTQNAEGLIKTHVAQAMPALFAARP